MCVERKKKIGDIGEETKTTTMASPDGSLLGFGERKCEEVMAGDGGWVV